MKKIADILRSDGSHWVGDGFPVRSLFSYHHDSAAISPFLLFDYAGPHRFDPTDRPRGVGQHPHRGFETVTIVYDGEVAHRDSAGNGGIIGPGDVQWMTAARGIIHEEFHSPNYSKTGGPFRMVQLWVNLPAKDKMSPPGYQAITSARYSSRSRERRNGTNHRGRIPRCPWTGSHVYTRQPLGSAPSIQPPISRLTFPKGTTP